MTGFTTLVISLVLHGCQAIELSNRMWRKEILPVGEVQYQGRTLFAGTS